MTLRVCIPEPGSVVVEDITLPEPAPGSVTLRVQRAGICGSDLHTYRRGHPWLPYPIRPGHELCGVVARVGPGVSGVSEGDAVLVNPVVSCGRCRPCSAGLTNLCDQLVGVGSHIPGGMAEEVIVPLSTLVPLPSGLSMLGASLVEPAATAARAVGSLGTLMGSTVLVLGTSTIGLLALGMIVAGGAPRVVATDLDPAKRARALEFGADAALDAAAPDLAERVLGASGRAPDAIIDCVGSPTTVSLAVGLVAKAGTVLVVGADHGTASLPLASIQDREVTVRGMAMYSAQDFSRALCYVADHEPLVSALVSAELPFARAAEAFELAQSGREVKVQLVASAAGYERGVPCRS